MVAGGVHVVGYTDDDLLIDGRVDLYDPITGAWTRTGNLLTPQAWHTATLLTTGKVLVIGEGTASAELYDPVTGTWSATGELPESFYLHLSLNLLSDGKVLVTGFDSDDHLTKLHLYDPAAGIWSNGGNLTSSRWDYTSTLLPNGRVLFAGGYTRDTSTDHNPLNVAELYDPGLSPAPPPPCPIVSGINPASGIVGSSVTISGTNFTEVTAIRFSNDVNAYFTIDNPNQITAVVPAGAGNGPITISLSGCADVQTSFFYVSPACPLSILRNIQNFSAKAGAGTISITTGDGCAWDVSNSIPWLTIVAGESGIGSGTVHFTLAPNSGLSRVGEMTVGAHTFTVRQGTNFLDVPPDDVFYEFIGKLSAAGITTGCDPSGTMYCPGRAVTREEMAVFIMRAVGSPDPAPPTSQRFADVPPTNPFYRFIEQMANLGITVGCNAQGPLYCPSSIVTREQMAAFIIRALGEFNPPPPQSQRFLDVPTSSPFYGFIDQMAIRGITLGCGLNLYCPTAPVTREQMAAFLARAVLSVKAEQCSASNASSRGRRWPYLSCRPRQS